GVPRRGSAPGRIAVSTPTVDLPTPERALAIDAHPDDVGFGSGATLAKWAAAGCEVPHLVCTDGSKGSWAPAQDLAELVAQRREEQREAARALGATGEVVVLDWPDGGLESGVRQRWEVAYCIRPLRPAVVLGHGPGRPDRLHPHHRHAGFPAGDGRGAGRHRRGRVPGLARRRAGVRRAPALGGRLLDPPAAPARRARPRPVAPLPAAPRPPPRRLPDRRRRRRRPRPALLPRAAGGPPPTRRAAAVRGRRARPRRGGRRGGRRPQARGPRAAPLADALDDVR